MFEILGFAPDFSISSSSDCVDCFRKIWDTEMMEHTEMVYVIYLNRKREPMFFRLLNIGTYTETMFDLRTAFYYALQKHSNNIIIAHNHTSGVAKPSQEDKDLTSQLVTLCSILEINLVDHIIITKDDYYSFRDGRLLK